MTNVYTTNQPLVGKIGDLGILGAHFDAAGAATLKIGGDMTCAVGTNTYEVAFTGFKQTPVVVAQQHDSSVYCQIVSASTSTCTIQPRQLSNATTATNGGTATTAVFELLIMGSAYL